MQYIQDLFDPSKKINRTIESVVTFGANTAKDLKEEINEYVVTDKLHRNYEDVIQDLQTAFDDGSKEVGIWVSGFYGSGKSSFAKYLGLSFDKSLLIDGVSFGEKLMSRIQDSAVTAMHKTIIARHNPEVVMIDLSTQSVAGKVANVTDIVYFETLKLLNITKCSDQKVMCFIDMLHSEGKYDEFLQLVLAETNMPWESIESNDLAASMTAAKFAPRLLPAFFPDAASFMNMQLNSALNEKERFQRLYKLIKEKTGHDKVIFVLDEVGQYVSSNVDLILNVQGMMQIFKDEFRGSVWVIATAQQTLTEDNHQAQLNSNELFRLKDRFPENVDIEANDIKEIITKRLLGKSQEGQSYLVKLFNQNEGIIKNNTHLTVQSRSIYNQVLTEELFANLYPFLPVHIDILLSLLQKLASRTGGVGLRSVIRLIRDILVENHLADATIGQMAGPEHFFDVLRTDMEKNTAKEIVAAADKAIRLFSGDALAIRICKTIAVMQLLDDFNLSFDNLCALLYNKVGSNLDKSLIRKTVDEIISSEGLTLQEIEGKYQFMTDAILGIRDERNNIIPRDTEKAEVMQALIKDMMTPAPSVNVFSSKTITAGLELNEKGRTYTIYPSSGIKINVRFVDGASFAEVHQTLLTESTRPENTKTLYWLCTLNKSKDELLQEIVRSRNIKNRHQNETNKEIQAYLRAQTDNADEKSRQLSQILRDAQANSEIIFRGSPQQVDGETYRTVALKQVAEKVFEKYPLASVNMKSDCVNKVYSYADLTTIPSSLNPLQIINTNDGTINASHAALSEIKEYVSMRTEVTGQDLITYFERDPYGWSKDTCRYLVALMLKASVVQLRVAGKDITVFGQTAVDALSTNNNFNRISISLNTEGALTVQELLKAAQNLTSLFNSSRISPVKDQIAAEALKKLTYHSQRFGKLLPDFEYLRLAGLSKVQKAMSYAKRIIESEGGEAAYLLGKDTECPNAFKYVMDVYKKNSEANMIDQLKHVNRIAMDMENLPEIPMLSEFRKNVNNVKQLYNQYIANVDIHQIAPEIKDLRDQLDSYVEGACVKFQTEANASISNSREEMRQMEEYGKLSDAQRLKVDTMMDSLDLDCPSSTLDQLREMVNKYTQYYIPLGRIETIKAEIRQLAKENEPAVTTQPAPQPSTPTATQPSSGGVGEPVVRPCRMSLKRQLKTREELQTVITELSNHLDDISEETPIEFSINV